MDLEHERLDFVTIEGLAAYGEALTRSPPADRVTFPDPPPPETAGHRVEAGHRALACLRKFVEQAGSGFPDAEAYRAARHAVFDQACGGD
ncbi:MAG: hypothetical protein ACREI3_04990, partial [Nitrospirales bacterium]